MSLTTETQQLFMTPGYAPVFFDFLLKVGMVGDRLSGFFPEFGG
jgi:hypothetical protein